MAEILIPVKNPPKNCHECKNGWCNLWEQNKNMTTGKHPDCPLVELPPHGRLGDLDALSETIDCSAFWDSSDLSLIRDIVNYAPTIIEASKEG